MAFSGWAGAESVECVSFWSARIDGWGAIAAMRALTVKLMVCGTLFLLVHCLISP